MQSLDNSLFSCTRGRAYKLYVGPQSDTNYLQTLTLHRLLYPKMKLLSEWQGPGPGPGEAATGGNADSRPDIGSADYGPGTSGNVGINTGFRADSDGFINDMAFSMHDKEVVAACSTGDVYMLDPRSQRATSVLKTSHSVLKVIFLGGGGGGGKYFVSGSADNAIRIWDIRNTRRTVNTLCGHSNVIRSLDYDTISSKLISSSYNDYARYWHIPSYLREGREVADIDSEDTASQRGVLFKCPDINQICINWSCKKLLCITSKGVMFVINNLNMDRLKEDMRIIKFDDSLPLLLSWIKPDSSTNRQNYIKIIRDEDYNPNLPGAVSKIHHVTLHPHLPIALLRFTTLERMTATRTRKVRDWTCIYNLETALQVKNYSKHSSIAFGSEIVEENLLYASEEMRYWNMMEKKASFNNSGKIIASPDKNGVRLLAYSKKLDPPLSMLNERSPLHSKVIWSSERDRLSELHVVARIPRRVDSVLCTKFSSTDPLFLAVGEKNNRISFHQPQL